MKLLGSAATARRRGASTPTRSKPTTIRRLSVGIHGAATTLARSSSLEVATTFEVTTASTGVATAAWESVETALFNKDLVSADSVRVGGNSSLEGSTRAEFNEGAIL
jgi:hypothetical protein